jgi:hypothetical protein
MIRRDQYPLQIIYYISQTHTKILIDMSRGSSVGIKTSYGLDRRVRFPAGASDFSLLYNVQTGSGVHPASYTMGTGGLFPWRLVVGA